MKVLLASVEQRRLPLAGKCTFNRRESHTTTTLPIYKSHIKIQKSMERVVVGIRYQGRGSKKVIKGEQMVVKDDPGNDDEANDFHRHTQTGRS